MRYVFEEPFLFLAILRKDNFGDGRTVDISRRVKNRVSPALANGGHHLRLAQYFMPCAIRIQHTRPEHRKHCRDRTLTANDSADDTDEEHELDLPVI